MITLTKCAEILYNALGEPCTAKAFYDEMPEFCDKHCQEKWDAQSGVECWKQFLTVKAKEFGIKVEE